MSVFDGDGFKLPKSSRWFEVLLIVASSVVVVVVVVGAAASAGTVVGNP